MNKHSSSQFLEARSRLRKIPPKTNQISYQPDQNIPKDKEFYLSGKTDDFNYNFTWIRGHRPTMEDAHLAHRYSDDLSIFGVFDGHGGKVISHKVVEILPGIYLQLIIDYFLENRERRKHEHGIEEQFDLSTTAKNQILLQSHIHSSSVPYFLKSNQ